MRAPTAELGREPSDYGLIYVLGNYRPSRPLSGPTRVKVCDYGKDINRPCFSGGASSSIQICSKVFSTVMDGGIS